MSLVVTMCGFPVGFLNVASVHSRACELGCCNVLVFVLVYFSVEKQIPHEVHPGVLVFVLPCDVSVPACLHRHLVFIPACMCLPLFPNLVYPFQHLCGHTHINICVELQPLLSTVCECVCVCVCVWYGV
jgi:hypothetical protein